MALNGGIGGTYTVEYSEGAFSDKVNNEEVARVLKIGDRTIDRFTDLEVNE